MEGNGIGLMFRKEIRRLKKKRKIVRLLRGSRSRKYRVWCATRRVADAAHV